MPSLATRRAAAPHLRMPMAALAITLLAVVAATAPAFAEALAAAALEREAVGLAAFSRAAEEPVQAVLVELRGTPGFVAVGGGQARPGEARTAAGLAAAGAAHRLAAVARQDQLLASLSSRGVRALLRTRAVNRSQDGATRIEYRFSWLLDGFVAYVPESQVARLRALPEVRGVYELAEPTWFLDNSVNYVLGSQPTVAARRADVYGASEKLGPADPQDPDHPEAPDWAADDGYEGQETYLAVIDSGLDYEHPMFGGTGTTTAAPQEGGAGALPPSPDDNQKVVYFYNLGGSTTLDDFGHGTHVASTAAGFAVDGTTPATTTGVAGPPGGVQLHGVAPQAKILAYPVCDASSRCLGDIELAIEDAASPFVLTGSGDGGATPTAVPKPVADVINLSLGDTSGSPAGASSRVSNNAALAGLTVVAAAGNAGPGAGTVGAPCAGSLVFCVAAAQDPGSVAGADLLAAGETSLDPCAGSAACVSGGPAPETGGASEGNAADPAGPVGRKLFPMAGGGAIPGGSLSAHYVYVDRGEPNVPLGVTGRIAVLKHGSGTFFQIVNPVATLNPAAILLLTPTTNATAVMVVNDVPVFTIGPDDGDAILDRLLSGDNDTGDPPHGAVSEQPLRVKGSVSPFEPDMGDFSSRGPNDHPLARFRTIKPDIAAPGVGVLAATTQTGNPDDAIGMANVTGYTSASGTSMASPHVAGAALLVRQRLRELGFDSTNLAALDYRDRRFEAAGLTRALLTNTATNLRDAAGLVEAEGELSLASVGDMGGGLMDVSAALAADAVLWGPVTLFEAEPDEYTPATGVGGATQDLQVMIPTHSFGAVPIAGVEAVDEREQRLVVRALSAAGEGVWHLTTEANRNAAGPGVTLSFTDEVGAPITSVEVLLSDVAPAGFEPAGEPGKAFRARIAVNGTTVASGTEIQYFVIATHAVSGERLRMPFYYRAVAPTIVEAGVPQVTTGGTDGPAYAPCPSDAAGGPSDADGVFQVGVSYAKPSPSAPDPLALRLQRGTDSAIAFFDDADEPLAAGANTTFAGSEQWTTSTNPDTGSPAYWAPDAVEQNESLAMIDAVALPAGRGASFSFRTHQDTEQDFDFAIVELQANGGGWVNLGSFSGFFSGVRTFDLSAYAGSAVRVRFRMVSDLLVSAPGWWVEDVTITTDDFATLVDLAPPAASHTTVEPEVGGWFLYRAAGLFASSLGPTVGPYSEPSCVFISLPIFADDFESGGLTAWSQQRP